MSEKGRNRDTHRAEIALSATEAEQIKAYLSLEQAVEDAGSSEVLYSTTAHFDDGCQADFKVVNGDRGPWSEVVLFDPEGHQIGVTEPWFDPPGANERADFECGDSIYALRFVAPPRPGDTPLTLRGLINDYIQARKEHGEKVSNMSELERHAYLRENSAPMPLNRVLIPIAQAVAEVVSRETGCEPEANVRGPSGLANNYTITVAEDSADETEIEVRFSPSTEPGSLSVPLYSRNSGHYPPHTIGAVNGFNVDTVEVPIDSTLAEAGQFIYERHVEDEIACLVQPIERGDSPEGQAVLDELVIETAQGEAARANDEYTREAEIEAALAAKEAEASALNNEGPQAQVRYLLKRGFTLREIREDLDQVAPAAEARPA